jgi:hypothetical protein
MEIVGHCSRPPSSGLCRNASIISATLYRLQLLALAPAFWRYKFSR